MEIERRFLLAPDVHVETLLQNAHHTSIIQGYIFISGMKSMRVRITDTASYITIKQKIDSCSAQEFEYEIPEKEAQEILSSMTDGYVIRKKRFYIPHSPLQWEIDIFSEENIGLIIAEIELPTVDTTLTLPRWIGKEITKEYKYSNASLSKAPYTLW